eukprot:1285689-Rhodomonas_salina.2
MSVPLVLTVLCRSVGLLTQGITQATGRCGRRAEAGSVVPSSSSSYALLQPHCSLTTARRNHHERNTGAWR